MITFYIKEFLSYKPEQKFYFEAPCGTDDAFWSVVDALDAALTFNQVPRERCEWTVVPKIDYGISKIYVEFWFTQMELAEPRQPRWGGVKEKSPFRKFELEYLI